MDERNSIDPALLELVRCPRTLLELRIADQSEIEVINEKIRGGECFDADGEPVASEVQGGLLTTDGHWFYPIRENIPTLIPGEAIEWPTSAGPAQEA